MLHVLGALLMASGIAAAQQEDHAAASLPAEAMACVSADVQQLRAFWGQVKGSSLGQFLSKSVAKGKPAGTGDLELGPILDMLGQAFQGSVSVALIDEKIVPKQVPAMVAVLPVKNREQVQGLLTVMQMQLTAKKLAFATRDYQGVTITSVSGEKLKGIQPSYVLLEDRLLVATRSAWVEKAIDVTAGRAQGLAADAKFQRVRALVTAKGPAPAWFWMDPIRFNKRTVEMAEEAARSAPAEGKPEGQPAAKPNPLPIKPEVLQSMMEAYTAAGGRLELSTEGIAFDTFALVNGENDFGRKLLAQKGAPLRSAQLTSANAILYIGFNNLPFLVEVFQTVLGSVEGDVQQMIAGIGQTIQAATGLDPKADILDHIGTEFAIALNDLPPDLKSVPALIYVHAKSVAGLGKTMQKLRVRAGEALQIKFVEKSIPQGRYYYMAEESMPIPIAPGWTFAGDFLVIGATPDSMKSPLFLAKGTGNSLAASPAYQRAVAAANDRLLGVFFVNLVKVTAIVDKLPMPKPKEGKAPAVDPAAAKQAMKALRTLSAVSSMQEDAMAVRIDLGLDLVN
jgi:hypothetical protein